MDTSDLSTVLVLLLLIVASAFFSASETAYTSLNIVRIKRMASDGNKRAEKVVKLSERYDELLSAILVGNNIVNIVTASLMTVLFVRYFGNRGVSLSTIVTTVIVLLFGEIAPKNLAKDHAESIALRFYPVLVTIMRLMTPINFLLKCWQKLVGKLIKPGEERGITEDELITIVEEAESEGEIDASESELIRSAIEFTDVDVEEILTPRVNMETVSVDAGAQELRGVFEETGYSRLPVFEDTVDNIVGILHEKDFYEHPEKFVRELMANPAFVMQTTKVSDALRLLQKSKTHMAIVVDEYDGVQGIVTMEDILEELVGEIWDEHDEVVEDYKQLDDGSFLVSGSANLDDMLELFDVRQEYDPVTVNGWVREELGRFPKAGDEFDCNQLHVRVEKADKRRATEVRIRRNEAETAEGEEE